MLHVLHTDMSEEHSLVAEAIPVIPGMALLLHRKETDFVHKKRKKQGGHE